LRLDDEDFLHQRAVNEVTRHQQGYAEKEKNHKDS